jgi:hypothetical protein
MGVFLYAGVSGLVTELVCIHGKQNTQLIQSGFDGPIGVEKTMAFLEQTSKQHQLNQP